MEDLILDSLRRRMRAMHSLWEDAMATMGPAQVNHVERDQVLPIAFSLFHFVQIEDGSASLGAYARQMIATAVARGFLAPDSAVGQKTAG